MKTPNFSHIVYGSLLMLLFLVACTSASSSVSLDHIRSEFEHLGYNFVDRDLQAPSTTNSPLGLMVIDSIGSLIIAPEVLGGSLQVLAYHKDFPTGLGFVSDESGNIKQIIHIATMAQGYAEVSLLHISTLLETAFPSWDDSDEWFSSSLADIIENDTGEFIQEHTIERDNYIVSAYLINTGQYYLIAVSIVFPN